jgi:iron complex transport system permease protein
VTRSNKNRDALSAAGNIDSKAVFIVLIIILIITFSLDIFLGSVSLHPLEVLRTIVGRGNADSETIVMKFRLPKAVTALMVGIALSISGLQMQTIFRNPMAGPYVLGISSGASLGVAFVILGYHASLTAESIQQMGAWTLVAASWLGAGLIMILVVYISMKVRDILVVLILGIMLASGISAVVNIMQYFSNETMLKAYVVWTMGSLGNLTLNQLRVLLITLSGGILLSLISVKMLNALTLGENYAASIGLNVKMARITILVSTSILAGSVTAFCGPVGFIGIAVPHIARMFFKTSDNRVLMPATILIGGITLLASDIISQLPGYDMVLPLNSVTSFVGIPVVVWVILRNQKYSGTL